jgi:hypothetical protein
MDSQGSFTTERDFGALHAKDSRVPARRAERREHRTAGQEAQFHQSVSEVKRQIQVDQSGSLAASKLSESARLAPARVPFDTELHLLFSIIPLKSAVNYMQGGATRVLESRE